MVGPVGRNDGGRVFRLLNFFILPSSLFPHRFIPLFWHVIKNKQLYSLWSGAVLAAVSLYITNSNTDTQPRETRTFYLTWDFKNYTLHPHTADIPVFSNRKESQSGRIVFFLLFNQHHMQLLGKGVRRYGHYHDKKKVINTTDVSFIGN